MNHSYAQYDFKTRVSGDAWTLPVYFNWNLAGWTISKLILKKHLQDPDSAKAAEIPFTVVALSPTGHLNFTFSSAQTAGFEGYYYGKLTATDSEGKKRTLLIGTFQWEKR